MDVRSTHDTPPSIGVVSPRLAGTPATLLDVAEAAMRSSTTAELIRRCEPLLREVLGAVRVTITTEPVADDDPSLRIPLTAGGPRLGELRIQSIERPDRAAALRAADLVGLRLADLTRRGSGRSRPESDDDGDGEDRAGTFALLEEREHLFRTALDATLDPVTIAVPVHDDRGGVQDFELVWCNRAHLDGGGARPGSTLAGLAGSIDSLDVVEAHRRVLDTGDPLVVQDVRITVPDGAGDVAETFVDLGIARFGDGLLTSYRPATERVRAQHDLRESERLFRSAFDDAPLGMVLFDLSPGRLGTCLRVNAAFQELTGYTEVELLDGGWHAIVPDDETRRTGSLFHEFAGGLVHRRRIESTLLTARGTTIAVQTDFSVVTRGGRPAYGVAHVEDVTERRRNESELTWLAMHDPLTGLANRHLFVHHLQFALTRLERRPGAVAALRVGIAGFDALSRRLGRDASGVVLIAVARRLASAVRRSDTASYVGGDDFAVLLPEVDGAAGARTLAGRVLEALRRPILVGSGEVTLTPRVGIALTTESAADVDALLDLAESVMASPADGVVEVAVLTGAWAAESSLDVRSDVRSEVVEPGERHGLDRRHP